MPDIDRVFVDEGDERALAERMSREAYSACVVTWATSRTAAVPWRAGIAVRVGQARRFYSHRFTKRVVVRSERGDVTSHWSDVLLDFARAIGCDTDDRRYRFLPTPQDEAEAGKIAGGRSDFILLSPCNAIAARRRWPVEGWATLAAALRERYGVEVLVSGSRADAPLAEAIVARVAGSRGGRLDRGVHEPRLVRCARAAGARVCWNNDGFDARCGGGRVPDRRYLSVSVGLPGAMVAAGRSHRDCARNLSVPPRGYQRALSRLRLYRASR